MTVVENKVGGRIEDCVGGGCEEGKGKGGDGGVDLKDSENTTRAKESELSHQKERRNEFRKVKNANLKLTSLRRDYHR